MCDQLVANFEPCVLTSGQLSFSRLMNPDWSIQISGAPAVSKVERGYKTMLFRKEIARCKHNAQC